MGSVQALGVAGGSAGVEAAVASLTTSNGLLLNTRGLAAEWVDGLGLLDATVGVTRRAAGPETNGDGWKDRQMWGATDNREGRVGALHRLGVRVGCGAAAMERVLALGVARGDAGVEAAVAGLTTCAGLLLHSRGLAAVRIGGITLENVAA